MLQRLIQQASGPPSQKATLPSALFYGVGPLKRLSHSCTCPCRTAGSLAILAKEACGHLHDLFLVCCACACTRRARRGCGWHGELRRVAPPAWQHRQPHQHPGFPLLVLHWLAVIATVSSASVSPTWQHCLSTLLPLSFICLLLLPQSALLFPLDSLCCSCSTMTAASVASCSSIILLSGKRFPCDPESYSQRIKRYCPCVGKGVLPVHWERACGSRGGSACCLLGGQTSRSFRGWKLESAATTYTGAAA